MSLCLSDTPRVKGDLTHNMNESHSVLIENQTKHTLSTLQYKRVQMNVWGWSYLDPWAMTEGPRVDAGLDAGPQLWPVNEKCNIFTLVTQALFCV